MSGFEEFKRWQVGAYFAAIALFVAALAPVALSSADPHQGAASYAAVAAAAPAGDTAAAPTAVATAEPPQADWEQGIVLGIWALAIGTASLAFFTYRLSGAVKLSIEEAARNADRQTREIARALDVAKGARS